MGFIFDIVLIVVFIYIVLSGYKKGLFKSIMDFASIIIQFFAAKTFGKYLSEFLYNTFTRQHFTNKILQDFSEIVETTVNNLNLDKLLKSPPPEFVNIVKIYGSDINELQNYVDQGVRHGTENVNTFVAEKVIEPAAKSLTDFISFFIVFFVTAIVLRLIIFLIERVLTLPVLKIINRTGGLIVGSVFGVVVAFVLAFLLMHFMQYFITVTKDGSTENFLQSSFIFKMFYDFFNSGQYINIF